MSTIYGINVYLESYGCTAIQASLESIRGQLQRVGVKEVSSPDLADLTIVNSCIVKQSTEHKIKERLQRLAKSGYPLIITGCLPVIFSEWIEDNIPSASMVSPDNVSQIVSITESTLAGVPVAELSPKTEFTESLFPKERLLQSIGIVETSRGCLGDCSYCIVKRVRGKLRSRSQEEILGEVRRNIREGCKEIWITAQDTGAYGKDFVTKTTLPELIQNITSIPGDFRVRVGMMTPWTALGCLTDLLEAFNSPKVYKFLHIPIQSGSDNVLRRMRRRGDVATFVKIVEAFRENFPQSTFSTDIIAGFPGESEEDHQASLDLIKLVRPEIVNLSKYTDRPGTTASSLKEKLPSTILARRSKELSNLIEKVSEERNSRWIGWEGEAFVQKKGRRGPEVIGRNLAYVPLILEKMVPIGIKLQVKIVRHEGRSLVGEIQGK